MKYFFRVPAIFICSFSLICAMLVMAKASLVLMLVGAYIIPYLAGSCLYFSTFPAIFCLVPIEFSRSDPHYSCGKFELFNSIHIIFAVYFSSSISPMAWFPSIIISKPSAFRMARASAAVVWSWASSLPMPWRKARSVPNSKPSSAICR